MEFDSSLSWTASNAILLYYSPRKILPLAFSDNVEFDSTLSLMQRCSVAKSTEIANFAAISQ